ncbi:MAG TPA: pitrilysin family protein, partial [Adhaeribacter sp.]|nr:pitrilysin family protein [Adhaeribacter sp.]
MLNRTMAPPVYELETIHLPTAETENLPGGSRVHYLPNSTQAVLRFEMVFPAGKWYESKKGVSYFTSKLLMEGTRNRSAKQVADLLDFYGASLECNQGFDWSTITLYCLSKHFPLILPLIQEILTEPALPERELDLLKIRTSQNLSVERLKPAFLASEKFSKNVFGPNHPYATGLTDEEIFAVTREDIATFISENYSVSEAEIIVSGDITAEHRSLISSAFQHAVPLNKINEINYFPASGNLIDLIPMPGSMQAAVRMGGLFPLVSEPDYLKLTVVNKILGGYFGSRLMKNIREEKGYTYGVYSTMSVRKHGTLFYIGTEVKADTAPDTITQIKHE